MVQLHHRRDEFEAKGARVIVIGNGPTWSIQGFREKSGFDGDIYTDPTLTAYKALGLRRSKRSSINLATIRNAFSAYQQGFRQDSVRGDPWQQGGVFVVTAKGELQLAYESRFAGDHPPIRDILNAVD